ncbi:MAG: TerB family tellurite resistance protein [Deltaproteobacteria bacterium]|nr:TerB family tellurite resistance protein [Deltaproteobacteria bacterium]
MNPNVAKCLVVSKVLVADGMMTGEEREFLDGMMATLGLSDGEKRTVYDLEGIDDADALVKTLPLEERQDIISQLVDAASADGKLSPLELDVVKRVTKALGI